jgi:phosphohistidine phosphatase
MKTLLLMRHAKSSWKEKNLPDHDRSLKKRGKKNAIQVGELLKTKGLVPQKIFCSTAERASKTAAIVAKECGYHEEIEYRDDLYMAEPTTIFNILRTVPDEVDRVMVVGHNPGLEGIAQVLDGRVVSLPTASIAYIILPIKGWQEINNESDGQLVDVYQAKGK